MTTRSAAERRTAWLGTGEGRLEGCNVFRGRLVTAMSSLQGADHLQELLAGRRSKGVTLLSGCPEPFILGQ